MNYMYILKCSDSSLYTGWTNDLDKRFKVHSQGKGAKYTKGRLPVELVYFEEFDNKIEAMKREYEVKQLTRKEKQKLIIENGYKKKIDKKSESNIIEL
ncbi:GIY-YIG nuclease family protein [Clostridium gasigenes]|uniref:Putative endonuclease n=1 Tax=Clostridium gasigenes TaxID=94869 RepID=A0A1H0SP83_9CLOT|nr:GIY-YIG nuclease family protein [Clostridium gasigenes]MBU3089050.1 GIY-YIG nuclease family protein [Clostridium gasigenes]SDP43068.1 putative endonuclease [Clostridium gasigenes]